MSEADIKLNDETLEYFKQEMNQFAQIQELINETQKTIKPLQEKLKQLKVEKKELEIKLCKTMKYNELSCAQLSNNNSVIEYKEKKAVLPVTQKSFREKLEDFFTSGPGSQLSFNSNNAFEKASVIYDYIYGKENRDYKVKQELKFSSQ